MCHNKTIDIAIDSPEEVCDLQPQKMCKQVDVDFFRLFRLGLAWLPHFIKFVKGKSSQGTNEAQKHKSYMFVIPCPIEVLVWCLNNKHCLPIKYAAEWLQFSFLYL